MIKIIPFGDRLLVKRRPIGDKLGKEGLIYSADSTKEKPTDLADIVSIPEHTFADKSILEHSEKIVESLTKKAEEGNAQAMVALLQINQFLKIKSLKEGDSVMISKYIGTTFHDNKGGDNLTLVDGNEIIGMVIDE